MKTITFLSTLFLSGLAFSQKAEIFRSCVKPNTIAITIDDGPAEKNPELLEVLDKMGIKATFYVNCANLLRDPATDQPLETVKTFLKEIYDKGHEIGSHTYNHACFSEECLLNNPGMKLMNTKEAFTEQIVKNEEYIYQAIGKYPATYRAPFGDGQNPGFVNDTLLEWLYELGYPYAIHWDIETQDMEFQANPATALAKAQEHYNSDVGQKDTLITLQHTIPVTVEQILPWVKDVWAPAHPNMKFVKVSECLGLTDDDVYKTSPGVKKGKKVNGGSSSNENSGATSIFNGILGTVAIIAVNTLLNYFF